VSTSEYIQLLKSYFTEKIPFNQLLGIEIASLSPDLCELHVEMKPELVGNTFYMSLHGGVTAAVLDVAGGLVAMANAINRFENLDPKEIIERLKNTGTIDMRIDYLLPGRGKKFKATGKIIRHGRKVSVSRMEFVNERSQLLALGTATYLLG